MSQIDQVQWIPLMEYAMKSGVSLSTLRRHIKANKIEYKVENGKYFLQSDLEHQATLPVYAEETSNSTLHQLQFELKKAQEEIAELKMLIAIYEEQMLPPRLNN